jgi:hypothetical protein
MEDPTDRDSSPWLCFFISQPIDLGMLSFDADDDGENDFESWFEL